MLNAVLISVWLTPEPFPPPSFLPVQPRGIPPPASAAGGPSLAALAPPQARSGGVPQQLAARRSKARRGLDMWLRMGDAEDAGGSRGEGPV